VLVQFFKIGLVQSVFILEVVEIHMVGIHGVLINGLKILTSIILKFCPFFCCQLYLCEMRVIIYMSWKRCEYCVISVRMVSKIKQLGWCLCVEYKFL
jgi:hypothetical protein